MTWDEVAYRAWPVLAAAARRGETIARPTLAAVCGASEGDLSAALTVIGDYCSAVEWPPRPLDARRQTRDQARKARHATLWDVPANPFDYAALGLSYRDGYAYAANRARSSPEKLARYRAYRIAEVVFRRQLLNAYNQSCAFCGGSWGDYLSATPIVRMPSSKVGIWLTVENGLLLCLNHRRLFEAGLLTVTPDWKIAYAFVDEPHPCDEAADLRQTASIHGQPVRLPENPSQWPRVRSLRWHRKLNRDLYEL